MFITTTIHRHILGLTIWLHAPLRAALSPGLRDEQGEGVISAAIAVLIVAALGALMWVGFQTIWENAESATNSKIAEIGR